jgi:hypothetical protein
VRGVCCGWKRWPHRLKIDLTDEQVRLMERFSPEFRERHIETRHTGDLVAVDTLFVRALKGVGMYPQSVIGGDSRYAWGRLYTHKLPVTAVQGLPKTKTSTSQKTPPNLRTPSRDVGPDECHRCIRYLS